VECDLLSLAAMNTTRLRMLTLGLMLATAGACKGDGKSADKPANKTDKPETPKAAPSPAPKPTESAKPPAQPETNTKPPPANQPSAAGSGLVGCAKLFARATGKLPMATIECIERTMEGPSGGAAHKFDTKACNGLENAWPIGVGDFDQLWKQCQKDEKFGAAACDAVLAACFKP
jgi:hypothetical protein